MEYVLDVSKWITVPPGVALCPECGGELRVWIDEWDTKTGQVTECGFVVGCGDDDEDGDGEHRRYCYEGWVKTDAVVGLWLAKAVRVDVRKGEPCGDPDV